MRQNPEFFFQNTLRSGREYPMHVNVIGAGFCGLSVANFLVKKGFAVSVYDKENRVGGLIQTVKGPWGQYEKAAGSFLNSARLEEVSADLGIELLTLPFLGKRKYLYWEGRPRRFPELDRKNILYALRFIRALIFKSPRFIPQNLETIGEWGFRVLGPRLAPALFTALQGIYGDQPEKLSASLILLPLWNKKKNPTKTKLGRGSVYPVSGMQGWNEAVYKRLKQNKVRFYLGREVQKNQLKEKEPSILSLPAHQLEKAGWKKDFAPFCGIKYKSIVSVISFRKRRDADENSPLLRGFGCLFPSRQGFHSLGVILPDGQFQAEPARNPSEQKKILYIQERWILGEETAAESNEKISQKIEEDFRKFYQCVPQFCHIEITRYSYGLPAYNIALEKILSQNKTQSGNYYLFGNYTGSLGLTKLLDSAHELAEKIYREWGTVQ